MEHENQLVDKIFAKILSEFWKHMKFELSLDEKELDKIYFSLKEKLLKKDKFIGDLLNLIAIKIESQLSDDIIKKILKENILLKETVKKLNRENKQINQEFEILKNNKKDLISLNEKIEIQKLKNEISELKENMNTMINESNDFINYLIKEQKKQNFKINWKPFVVAYAAVNASDILLDIIDPFEFIF